MKKINVFGLALLAFATMALNASENPVQPIGYFVETVAEPDSQQQATSHAKFIRDGEEYDAVAGMPVFPGDIVSTPSDGGILVAFINNNTLQLQGAAQATIHGLGDLMAPNASQFTVNTGHAMANIRSTGESGLNLSLGDSKLPLARAAVAKPASLDIIVTKDANGNYVSNVACLAGSAILTPKAGGGPVTVSSAGFVLLKINDNTIPPSGTVSAGNISKATLAGLKANSYSETFVKMGKSSVSITSTIKNPDGSITTGKVTTTMNGDVTKDSWKTVGPNGFKESWTETPGTGKISVSQTFNGVTFKASFPGGTATITDKQNGQKYTGTATYDPNTGNMVFTTTKPGKDGSTATFTYNPYGGPNGSALMKVVVTGGIGDGTIQQTVVNGPTPSQTPDGRGINQNQPPKSQ